MRAKITVCDYQRIYRDYFRTINGRRVLIKTKLLEAKPKKWKAECIGFPLIAFGENPSIAFDALISSWKICNSDKWYTLNVD